MICLQIPGSFNSLHGASWVDINFQWSLYDLDWFRQLLKYCGWKSVLSMDMVCLRINFFWKAPRSNYATKILRAHCLSLLWSPQEYLQPLQILNRYVKPNFIMFIERKFRKSVWFYMCFLFYIFLKNHIDVFWIWLLSGISVFPHFSMHKIRNFTFSKQKDLGIHFLL